ncbi:glutamine-hydrolyzing GMP synthase [Candidatus Symbiobacter mobilis]|uniref:GMP synthase [glutamine-hydrolyzing] n=1 Tax=Candidatus Symbiobacter mobilis CR TaxID=946483 RepID=U5NB41_9BURK|nr:glutamine-hydrolyzing GMP synthase [Candidatus Symbiobacter mobilis]AGX88637.1 GMP synthase [Candidatus Symbiobacter mobilis CR]
MQQKILILDFGSQVTLLIARRIREAHVYCEVHPADVDDAWLRAYASDGQLRGIVLSGSHASVAAEDTLSIPDAVFTLGVPVLGICYGMQCMAHQLGGRVECGHQPEFGPADVRVLAPSPLFDGLADYKTASGSAMLHVWMSHGDRVEALPPGFRAVASTERCPIAAMADEDRRWYAVQFHPEVTHTRLGVEMLRRFVLDICGAQADWIVGNRVDSLVAAMRERVGSDQVILGLSGGVDSSVAAALLHRAIGQQLTCIFVDHGLLRQGESEEVMEVFAHQLHATVLRVDASEQFLAKLAGVSDPEAKRKIIGAEFIAVFRAQAERLLACPQPGSRTGERGDAWLAQGTIYPDVIESGSGKKAAVIKSHHNVGGLPEQLGLRLLEPLRDLFKDEVRELGLALGLPPAMVYRHPFPGPGLAVRILGEVRRDYADLLRRADAIFIEELRRTIDPDTGKSWYDLTSQAFTVFLPVKSVGVMGDGRTYEYVVALRAVQTSDFMTADWAELPYALLKTVSSRIINEVRGINRVTYDISSKPPATIEWE